MLPKNTNTSTVQTLSAAPVAGAAANLLPAAIVAPGAKVASVRKRERSAQTQAPAKLWNEPTQNLKVEYLTADEIFPAKTQSREHPAKQEAALRGSITTFGPNGGIYVDRDGVIVGGHAVFKAMQDLGYHLFPVIRLSHLAGEMAELYGIGANKIAEMASSNEAVLKAQLLKLKPAILKLQIEPEAFGISTAKFDDVTSPPSPDEVADQPVEMPTSPVTEIGDCWVLGDHRLLCGDALIADSYQQLMQSELARMAFIDAPYGVPIFGHVSGLGKVKHREFVMGAGEMSRQQFAVFIGTYLKLLQNVLMNGAIGYHCMDFRSIAVLINAGEELYGPIKQLIVWNKTNAGMGSFYRSKHELIAVFKNGDAPHVNNFGLGETGRYRASVWDYAGANVFGKNRDADLQDHPTVKPTAMVMDAIKDVSKPGEIVIDCFGGSGTTLLAAEKTSRKARLMELDPIYVDVAIKRWQALTGKKAVLEADGLTFDEAAADRGTTEDQHHD